MIKTQENRKRKKFVIKSWGFVQESPPLDNKPEKSEKKTYNSDD